MTANGEMRDFEDSREKLEADVYRAADEMDRFYCGGKFIDTRKIIGWLDRQAAITERYWRKQVDALAVKGDQLAKANTELRAKLDALKAHGATVSEPFCGGYEVYNQFACEWRERAEALEAERDELKAEIAKYEHDCKLLFDEKHKLEAERDEAVEAYDAHMSAHDAWHEAEDIKYTRNRFIVVEQAKNERIAALEAERDYWCGQVERCVVAAVKPERYAEGVMGYPRDELRFAEPALLVVDAIDGLRDFHAEDRIANKRLDVECDALARDLAESEKMRDELREKLSAAIGHAVEIARLQDLEEGK